MKANLYVWLSALLLAGCVLDEEQVGEDQQKWVIPEGDNFQDARESEPLNQLGPGVSLAPELEALLDRSSAEMAWDDPLLQDLTSLSREDPTACSLESITHFSEGLDQRVSETAGLAACCGGYPPCDVTMKSCGWCFINDCSNGGIQTKFNGTIKLKYDAACNVTVKEAYCGIVCGAKVC